MQILNTLTSIEKAAELISAGKFLCISGAESALKQLPQGKWIGGTIPYFMTENGGRFDKDSVFISDLSSIAEHVKIQSFSTNTIESFPNNRYHNGFTYLLVPGLSDIHSKYAMITHDVGSIMEQPVFGWISGIDLADLGKVSPKIVNGETGKFSDTEAIAMFVSLPSDKTAHLDIINIFEQDADGDSIRFETEGFSAKDCIVNGEKKNLNDYIKTMGIDTKFPLVADYSGVPINISFQGFDDATGITNFYAPVQVGVEYKLAKPIDNYMERFASGLETVESDNVVISCNCILNYLYAELENKKVGQLFGPITFGEIAYMLVNQTLVYLSVD